MRSLIALKEKQKGGDGGTFVWQKYRRTSTLFVLKGKTLTFGAALGLCAKFLRCPCQTEERHVDLEGDFHRLGDHFYVFIPYQEGFKIYWQHKVLI